MELGWETRPISLAHHPRDWRSQPSAGPSSPPTSFAPTSIISSRRRSSATHVPPPAPPPNQPIPRVPEPTPPLFDNVGYFPRIDRVPSGSAVHGPSTVTNTQSQINPPLNPQVSSSTPTENISNSPSRPILHPAPPQGTARYQAVMPDRLLSPSDTRPRPSSRRALTRALELAKEAVKLDSTNNDPYGAVVAYGRSVTLLSEVMERVRRGEDSTESSNRRRSGRRRSVVAQEEEVRRLKSIHDTYADRMNILSLIYSIPPIPHSPTSLYSSAISSVPDHLPPPYSPTSASPPSDSAEAPAGLIAPRSEDPPQQPADNVFVQDGILDRYSEAIGSAMFAESWDHSSQSESENAPTIERVTHNGTAYHPYAAVEVAPQSTTGQSSANVVHPVNRTSSLPRRHRASSTLPPPPPPPQNLPPPAPFPVAPDPLPESSSQAIRQQDDPRMRDAPVEHRRTASGSRLAALEEEIEKQDDQDQRKPYHGTENEILSDANVLTLPDTPRLAKRDSPLPALPSPRPFPVFSHNASTDTAPSSPPSSSMVSRSRVSSSSIRAEGATPSYLINSSPTMGTISQRRSKVSAPPSMDSSPTDSVTSTTSAPAGPKLTASSLPASTATSLGIGRNRASSQPGRRPSLVNGRISPLDSRPPLPPATGLNGSVVPRKASFPSKLNPNSQSTQSIVQPDLSSASGVTSPPLSLLPVPAVLQLNLPTTPTSPLPSAPPNDPLRKPYHLMDLLQTTMTSKTGGYITRRLHVPHEVWSQGGAKLTNVLEKVRVVEVLCSALEDLQSSSAEYFGAGNVSSGLALGIGSIGRKEGEAWILKLEDFSSVCDGVVANFGKKLGVGEGFVLKKASGVTSWGGKLTRQLDKFTNGKNLDSPAAYVLGLARLFSHAQLLDEHTRALSTQPPSAAYSAFPSDIRMAAEAKLKRASEFFATVVLTFVVRDLSQLLDKYAKKCEKWLAE